MSAPSFSRPLRAVALVGVLLGALGASPPAEPPRPLDRDHTVVLPEEEFARVLELHPDGVYLSYGEFLALWERAHASERELPPPPGAPDARVTTAELAARVDGQRLAIRARLALDVRAPGFALVPLPLGTLPWTAARLAGAAAPLTRLADGSAAVLVEGPVTATLEGELSAPAPALGSGGRATLDLPELAALSLRVEVPGRAEIAARGEGVLDTEELPSAEGTSTRAEIHVDTPTRLEITWRPRRATDAGDPGAAFRATSRTRLESQDGLLAVRSAVDLDVYRGALARAELSLPEGWRPVRLSHPSLSAWSVVPGEDAGAARLRLDFDPALEGESRLELDALRVVPAEPWETELSVPVVLGATRHDGRLTVLGSAERRLELRGGEGLQPIPADDAAALASYRIDDDAHRLELAALPPRELAIAESTTRVELAEGRATVRHALDVTLLEKRLFEVELEIPEGLRVISVTAPDARPVLEVPRGVSFPDRAFILDWHVTGKAPRRLVVALPPALADRPLLSLHVVGELPVDTLDGDEAVELPVPRIVPRGMDEVAGRILFFGDGALDVEESSREGLVPTGPTGADASRFRLGYRYEGTELAGVLAIRRAETRVECRQVALVGVDARASHLRARLRCETTGGGLRELRLALPHGSGEAVRIEAQGSEERFLESSGPERGDVWLLRLPGRGPGTTVVDVELERPLEVVGAPTELALPELRVLDVERSEGWTVLEASDDMALTLANPRGLAEVDRTDLPSWAPAPVGRVLAHLRFFEQPAELTVAAAPVDERAVLGAIVQQLSVTTQLGATLRSRAEAVVLNRALQLLPLELPEGAELWAVRVDGVGVKPTRRADGSLGIPLDERVDGTPVHVRLDYARPPGFRWLGVTALEAPRFGDVPVSETRWAVYLPGDRALIGTGGNMRTPELHVARHPLSVLPRLLAVNPVALVLRPLWGARMAGSIRSPSDDWEMAIPEPRATGEMMTFPADELAGGRADAQAPAVTEKLERLAQADRPAAPAASFDAARSARSAGLLSMRLDAPFEGRALRFARPEGDARLAIRSLDARTARTLAGLAGVGTALALAVAVRRRGRSLGFLALAGIAVTALLPGLLPQGIALLTVPMARGLLVGTLLLACLAALERWPRLPVLATVVVAAALLAPLLARAEEVHVFVPYGESDDPAAPTAEARAYLPRPAFEDLWARAHAERDREAPPVDSLLAAARYEGRVEGGAVRLDGRLGIEVVAEGWTRVPLDFGSMTLLSARGDDALLPIERVDGVPTLTLRGPARMSVEVSLEAPLAAGRDSVRLAFPRAGASHLSLALPAAGLTAEARPAPGGLTVRSGSPTTVELPLVGGPVELDWHRAGRATSALAAELDGRSESLYLVGPRDGELDFRLEATPRGAPVEAVELIADEGLEPLAAVGPDVAATEVIALDDGRTRVRVRLARPTSEAFRISLRWLWSYSDATDVDALPRVVVAGDRRLRNGVTLAPAAELAVEGESLSAPGWTRRAVPDAVAAALPPEHRAAASFELRAGATSATLRPALRRVPSRASAHTESIAHVRDGELLLDALVRIDVRDAPRYRLVLSVTGEGEIEAVEDRGGADAATPDGSPLAHRIVEEGEARRLVIVDLPRPVLGRRHIGVRIAHPAPDLSTVLEGTVELDVPVVGAREVERAVLELAVESVPGLEVEPLPGAAFEPVPSTSGRRYRAEWEGEAAPGGDASMRLALRPAALRVEATALDHIVVEDGRVESRTRLTADVVRGRVDRLHLLAPIDARHELRIEEPAGQRRVRSVVREADTVDGRDRWTVRLHEATSGPVELVLRRRSRAPAGEPLELEDVALEEATTLRRWLLVENRSSGEVGLESARGLGPARIEELPLTPIERAAARPLRVARADAAGWTLTLRPERLASGELVRAVVHEAHLESTVTRDGLLRTRARYRVQNASQPTLRVELPEGSELWSVKVAGVAAKPARDAEDERIVVVPILKNAPGDRAFEVELVTRDELGPLGLAGRERLPAPRVTNLPVSRTLWTLWAPPEQRYLRFGGSLSEVVSVEVTHQRIRGLVDEAKALEGQISQLEGASLANARQNWAALQAEAEQLYADAVSQRPDAYLQQKQVGARAERRYARMWSDSVNELAMETRAELDRATRSVEQQLHSQGVATARDREARKAAPAAPRPEPRMEQSRAARLRQQAMKESGLAKRDALATEEADGDEGFDYRGADATAAFSAAEPEAAIVVGSSAAMVEPVAKAGLLSLDIAIPTAGLVRYDFGKVGGEADLSVQHARRGLGAWLGRLALLAGLVAGAWWVTYGGLGRRILATLLARPRLSALVGVVALVATAFQAWLGWVAITLLVLSLVGARLRRARPPLDA